MRLFTEHPDSVGENYVQHMGSAFSFALTMLIGSLACFVHGVLPFLFTTTGKQTILKLHHRMVTHRHRDPQRQEEPVTESTQRAA